MNKNSDNIKLKPGNYGNNCLGNGEFKDKYGNPIECLCDECDFLECCSFYADCKNCKDNYCNKQN